MWGAIASIFGTIFGKYPLQAVLILAIGGLSFAVYWVYYKVARPAQRENAYRMKHELFKDQMKLWDVCQSELYAMFKSNFMTLRKEWLLMERMRAYEEKHIKDGKPELNDAQRQRQLNRIESEILRELAQDGEIDRFKDKLEIVLGRDLVKLVRVAFVENHLADKSEREFERPSGYLDDKCGLLFLAFNRYIDAEWFSGTMPPLSTVFSSHQTFREKFDKHVKAMFRDAREMAIDMNVPKNGKRHLESHESIE